MHSFQYLADGHHVDDAGNLIACAATPPDAAENRPVATRSREGSQDALV